MFARTLRPIGHEDIRVVARSHQYDCITFVHFWLDVARKQVTDTEPDRTLVGVDEPAAISLLEGDEPLDEEE